MNPEPIAALLGGRPNASSERQPANPVPLSGAAFLQTVSNAPLVAIDLLLHNRTRQVLVGLRTNRPANNSWFVPGGRILKNESMEAAFRRISHAETGRELRLCDAEFRGVFEHFYPDNFANVPGVDTHYLTLAYRMQIAPEQLRLPTTQHKRFRWLAVADLLASPDVHIYTKAYFKPSHAMATPYREYQPQRS